jgi:hypothetical protein
MTPKEKADELVKRMYKVRSDSVSDITLYFSKQCALIAVDEIIKSNPIIPMSFMLESESLDAARKYWKEVKQEIEKL